MMGGGGGECGNEPSGSIKFGEFRDCLRSCFAFLRRTLLIVVR